MLTCGDKVRVVHNIFSDHDFKNGDTVVFMGVIIEAAEPLFVFTNGEFEQVMHHGEFNLE